MGKRPKGEEAVSVVVTARLMPDEYKQFVEICESKGLSVSEAVRAAIQGSILRSPENIAASQERLKAWKEFWDVLQNDRAIISDTNERVCELQADFNALREELKAKD